MPRFAFTAAFQPAGGQPEAIARLGAGLEEGRKHQVLMGVTGSGKTMVVAQMIQEIQRPTLVMSPNKTLAAQLCSEFRQFFPTNAVEYFVSYYDYYQPEAYIPRSDTYIEKDSSKNDEIDRLRQSATRALLTRRDVIVVASVSCIYGVGSPEDYLGESIEVHTGEGFRRDIFLRKLTNLQYQRNDVDFGRARFRVRGDTVDVQPSYDQIATRVQFNGDQVERIVQLDPLTGEIIGDVETFQVFPATHYVTPREKLLRAIDAIQVELDERVAWFEGQGKLLEAQRLRQRTQFDMEMMRETGSCAGIENYSRHLTGRRAGQEPYTLMDFLPADTLVVVDESHVAVPQIGGMYGGDRSRKIPLVDYGFRLPSALDNRPLTFAEWERKVEQVVYVTATPGPYEEQKSQQTVEVVIRPTGLVDPTVEVRPTRGQIDDLLTELNKRVERKQRTLVTVLTKKMAEDLTDYLREMGVKVQYLHSEVDTLERVEILRDLRLGTFDVLVGINLLREGLDLPEVAFIAILDADKESYLRDYRSLIQTIGRAARNVEGHVILYGDTLTGSMQRAIDETNRRRALQTAYNEEHGITPATIVKAVYNLERQQAQAVEDTIATIASGLPPDEIQRLVKDLERQMKKAARDLQFERAAELRDRLVALRRDALEYREGLPPAAAAEAGLGRPRGRVRRRVHA
ncbi:MAG TPA: excinuclease ABC subunit UvrB [Candidatus Limnocylindria bacterium]|nr:excinuclease ABC subunit UvrB [Candidatus Limnocylindria bacterium]